MAISQAIIYLLCLATSVICAYLLVRTYVNTRTKLLLYSAWCFVLLAVNNLLVVIDLVVLTNIDLIPLRQLAAIAAAGVLLFGFVWEVE
jgi:Family of unknown function (DUF5985)